MRKRFIVLIDSATPEQEAKFYEWIKAEGLGWWHWLNNSFLLVDESGRLNAKILRNKVTEIYKEVFNIVLELGDGYDTYAGYGPSSEKDEKHNMFEWMRRVWKKK